MPGRHQKPRLRAIAAGFQIPPAVAPEPFDCAAFIAANAEGSIANYPKDKAIYSQGDAADALFYLIDGWARIHIVSDQGQVAVIAIVAPSEFFGEVCLIDNSVHVSTVLTAGKCKIARFSRATVWRALKNDPAFTSPFLKFLLNRNQQIKSALISHWFEPSEKRLARILLMLASAKSPTDGDGIGLSISQSTLATMVGTTRPRINQFMNKFRKCGYIEYNGHIKVRSSLLNVLLDDARVTSK